MLAAATLGEAAFETLPQVYSSAAPVATAQAGNSGSNMDLIAAVEGKPGVSNLVTDFIEHLIGCRMLAAL